jgi:glyoxylase-like metal-dependent hydrolase (beta-lactamase superfamily II)
VITTLARLRIARVALFQALLLGRCALFAQAQTAGPAAPPAAAPTVPAITTTDPSDPPLELKRGQVALESIAHACFRIHSASGARILIDPYASRGWLGYDFPRGLATDAILITHPHYDHDGDEFLFWRAGREPPHGPRPDLPVAGT